MSKWKRLFLTHKMWHAVFGLLCYLYTCQLVNQLLVGVLCGNVLSDRTVRYTYVDNITKGTAIGNIKRDAKLNNNYTREQLTSAKFTFLQMTSSTSPDTTSSYQQYFKLRESYGLLKTVATVDRDSLCPGQQTCVIKLDVAYRLMNKHFGTIRVLITLEDYNDNPPVFEDSHLEYSISETVSPGVLVHLPQAIDLDSPANGVYKYSLAVQEYRQLFKLEAVRTPDDGQFEVKIWLLEQLDREKQFRHEMVVTAHDRGNPSLTGNITVVFNVEDENDNSPKFLRPSSAVKVIENTVKGTVIYHVHASDIDAGVNGKIMYYFTNETISKFGNYFKIKSHSGRILLKKSLDFEERQSYTLVVIATDMGVNSLPAETKIIITVIDENDNTPVISIIPQYEGKLLVMENSDPTTFVAHISALDQDSNQNGIVTCILDEKSYEFFNLLKSYDGEYKLVTTKVLDREQRENYLVNITCSDQGTPTRTSHITKHVVVLDLNDHVPKFDRDLYKCFVLENNPPHTSVVTVQAEESDSGLNGAIMYKLEKDVGKTFQINESTGLIEAMLPLDREAIGDMFIFQVMAIDKSIFPQTSTATVKVTIVDQDDEGPRFTQKKYIFRIYENVEEKTSIGFVSASENDLEPNNRFIFAINSSKTAPNSISIHNQTGEVFADKPFDREKRTFHNVYVIAQSLSNPMFFDMTLVQVVVVDRNDNRPNITFPDINNNKVYISNTEPVNTKVSKIEAFDADEGINQRLTYHFHFKEEDIHKTLFRIDENTGEMYLNGSIAHLIHEKFPTMVVVKDQGHPSLYTTAIVTLIVSNKLSQLNAWDKTIAERDIGLSMAARIVIVCTVVVMSVVTIIGLSLLIRFIVVKTQFGDNAKIFGINLPLHLNSNGFIPNQAVETSSAGDRYNTDDTGNDSELESVGPFLVKRHRKPSFSSCPDYSEDSAQPFLDKTTDNKVQPPQVETKRKYKPPSIPPPPYSSSMSSPESLYYQGKIGQKRRSLPKAPLDDDSGTTTESSSRRKYRHNRSHSVCFQNDDLIHISYPENAHYHKQLPLRNNYASNKAAVMSKSDIGLNTPIRINVLDSLVKDSKKTHSVMALNEPIKIQTVGINRTNPPIKIQLPDVQIATSKRRTDAYPDLLQHRRRRHSIDIQQGNKKLKSLPYEDPWDNIDMYKGKLKHSIPGNCTIIAAGKKCSVDDLNLTNKAASRRHNSLPRPRTKSFNHGEMVSYPTTNYGASLNRKTLSISTPMALGTSLQHPDHRRMTLRDKYSVQPHLKSGPYRHNTQWRGNFRGTVERQGISHTPRTEYQTNRRDHNPDISRVNFASLDRNLPRNFVRHNDIVNLMSGRQKFDHLQTVRRDRMVHNYKNNGPRQTIAANGGVQGHMPRHVRRQQVENGDSDGSYI